MELSTIHLLRVISIATIIYNVTLSKTSPGRIKGQFLSGGSLSDDETLVDLEL
jgi:hypothetical protein